MKRLISLVWVILTFFILICVFPLTAEARGVDDEKFNFTVTGVKNYDYAYDVLSRLNSLRTSKGLSSLKMDKDLLDIAMRRAAEIAVYYGHVRPDGTSCFSLAADGGAHAENIAIRHPDPETVMERWTSSSGHYKNMTNSEYKSVGIGCFEASDGSLCWVQFFSTKTPEKITKSGVYKAEYEITALYRNTNMELHIDGYIATSAEMGDQFGVVLENTNKGFTYVTQKIDLTDFELSSSDPDVLSVDEDGICTVQGVGEVIITADSVTNEEVSFAFEEEIGQVHTYTDYVYNDDATCAKNGTKTALCDCGCGRQKTVYVYGTKLDHEMTKWETTKEPTCTEKGIRMRKCKNCTYWQKYSLSAKGHQLGEGVKTKAASYTEKGVISYTCKVCGQVGKKEYIPMLTLGKVKSLKVTAATDTTVSLSWNKVEGAKKYRVYRKVKGKWKRIKTVSTTYYTAENLKSASAHQFRVRAIINSDIKGSYSSSVEAVTKPAVPEITLKAASKRLTVSWQQASGVDGYQIRYSTSKSLKNAKTVTAEGGSNGLTVKKLKGKKRYYVKVRAYKIVDGKKLYSGWTEIRSVKTK